MVGILLTDVWGDSDEEKSFLWHLQQNKTIYLLSTTKRRWNSLSSKLIAGTNHSLAQAPVGRVLHLIALDINPWAKKVGQWLITHLNLTALTFTQNEILQNSLHLYPSPAQFLNSAIYLAMPQGYLLMPHSSILRLFAYFYDFLIYRQILRGQDCVLVILVSWPVSYYLS